ncbi:MAG: hypothetical protein ACYC8T_35205 [Myxococcaceae bacterium]
MRILSLVLLLCCCACDRDEVRALEARQAQLDRRLAEMQVIAQNLNEFRKEVDVLEQRVGALGSPDKPEMVRLVGLLAPVSPRVVAPSAGGTGLHVAGGGGASGAAAAWHALGPAAGGVRLRRVEVSSDGWALELTLAAAPGTAVAAPASAAPLPPAPPEGTFCGSRCEALRQRSTETERRIVELQKVLGEIGLIAARRAELRARLDERADTLASWLGILDALFSGERPLLESGTLDVEGREGRLTRFPLGKASLAAEALEDLADAATLSSAEVKVTLR